MATYCLSCFPDSRSWQHSAVLNRAFFKRFTLKNSSAECPESYRPHQNSIKLLTCSDFSENRCACTAVALCEGVSPPIFDTVRNLLQINAFFITIFPVVFPKPQSIPDEMRTADKNRQFLQRIDLIFFIMDDILRIWGLILY